MILEPRWKSYIVATAEPVLTPEQCDELISIGQNEPKINATIGTTEKITKLDEKYRKSIISWIPFAKAVPIYQVIRQWMEVTNNNYFGFDTVQLSEQGQYAEYHKGGFYNWHMDSNVEMASMPTVRKISMTLLLNDPKDFEGGDFEIFCGETLDSEKNKYKLKQGHAIFFASFLLHRVMPVIKGNRKSLVMWFGGSPLR
jgi:PKHD-type hydroxylase